MKFFSIKKTVNFMLTCVSIQFEGYSREIEQQVNKHEG